MKRYVGLDIGGTKFLAAVANDEGKIIDRVRADNTGALESDLELLDRMISQLVGENPIDAIGAAIGGPLDWKTGVVSPLHQLTWEKIPLKQNMQERWKCPFFVDVDTNVAALGEYVACGEEVEKFLYLTLSTGMGGGYIVNGTIYRGINGAHPEIGHQSIHYHCMRPEAIQCECGAPDCLEALISGNAIQRIYGKPAEELVLAEWDEVAYNLGQGLRNLVTILNPDVIRIGGGVAIGGGEPFIEHAVSVMKERLFLTPAPKIGLSCLGYDTALQGAITIALSGLYE
jgi:predicted NBD/HSP70 family sugar kinase